MKQYECYNTTTGDVEGYQEMDFDEAVERNRTLRQNGEPQRWLQVPVEEEETSTGEWENPYDNGLRPDELGEYDVPNEYNGPDGRYHSMSCRCYSCQMNDA